MGGIGTEAIVHIVHICTAADFIRFLLPVLCYLRQQGAQVTVVCRQGPETSLLASLGVNYVSVPFQRAVSLAQDVVALRLLTTVLRELNPDLVHAHTPKAGLLTMLALAGRTEIVRIYHQHGLRYETTTGVRRSVLWSTERLTCALADAVFCVSHSVQARAQADGVLLPGKSRVLGNGSVAGIDLDWFSPGRASNEGMALRNRLGLGPQALCIAYVGRIAKDKGIADLLRALPLLERVDIHLLLAGERDVTDPLDIPLSRPKRVHFLGPLKDTRPVYAISELLILPSYREGLPQVVLEAGAMGIPTVATRVTGVVDAVEDSVTGRLVPPRSPELLAEAIRDLVDDRKRRYRYGDAARKFVENHFPRQPILDRLLEAYDELGIAIDARAPH